MDFAAARRAPQTLDDGRMHAHAFISCTTANNIRRYSRTCEIRARSSTQGREQLPDFVVDLLLARHCAFDLASHKFAKAATQAMNSYFHSALADAQLRGNLAIRFARGIPGEIILQFVEHLAFLCGNA